VQQHRPQPAHLAVYAALVHHAWSL
jgi:hypothetical protein